MRLKIVALALAAMLPLASCAPSSSTVEAAFPDEVATAYMLFFDKDSFAAADSDEMLREIAAVLLAGQIKADINAFRRADEPAEVEQARIAFVVNGLMEFGVPADRLFGTARGIAPPINAEDDGTAASRVEIFLAPL